MSWKFQYVKALQLLILAALAIVVYSNTFSVPFLFDGITHISENPIIRDVSYFLHPGNASGFEQYEAFRTRYIGYLSLALNFRLHGLNVTGYHITNLLIHLINTFLVFALVNLLFRTPVLKRSSLKEQAHWVALVSAALFAVHPVQTQAVTYMVQRFASLATLFYLGTLVSYLRARMSPTKAGSYTFYFMAFTLCVLAMYTKQTAFTLPLAMALVEVMFLSGPWRGRIVVLAPFLLTMLIVPFNAIIFDTGVEGATSVLDIPRGQYLLTESRVLVTYLRLFFLPLGQSFDYDYPLYGSLSATPVVASLALLSAFFVLGVFMYKRSLRGEPAWRLVSWGVWMFFLALSVESTFIPLRPMFEHRMYLPSVGLCILTGAAGLIFFRGLSGNLRRAFVLAVISVFSVLALLTYERNGVWSSRVSLWSDVVHKAPNNARAHLNLGSAYYKAGKKLSAKLEYEESLSLYAPFESSYHALSREEHLNRLDASGRYARTAFTYAKLRYSMGIEAASEGRYEDAVAHFKAAADVEPGYVDPLFNLAIQYYNMGRTEEARAAAMEALRFEPGNKVVRELLKMMQQ